MTTRDCRADYNQKEGSSVKLHEIYSPNLKYEDHETGVCDSSYSHYRPHFVCAKSTGLYKFEYDNRK